MRKELTHAMSNRTFRAADSSITPIATLTPSANKAPIELCLVRGGPGNLDITKVLKKGEPCQCREKKGTTCIRLCSQVYGKGRGEVSITLIPALAISSARRCASVAPENVSFSLFPVISSYSRLRFTSVAMISALSTFMTSGISPYVNERMC